MSTKTETHSPVKRMTNMMQMVTPDLERYESERLRHAGKQKKALAITGSSLALMTASAVALVAMTSNVRNQPHMSFSLDSGQVAPVQFEIDAAVKNAKKHSMFDLSAIEDPFSVDEPVKTVDETLQLT